MENIVFIIGTGIIAGLVTTIIIVVLRSIWNNIIKDWYLNALYSDTKIEGQWYGRCDYYDNEIENGCLDIRHKKKPKLL